MTLAEICAALLRLRSTKSPVRPLPLAPLRPEFLRLRGLEVESAGCRAAPVGRETAAAELGTAAVAGDFDPEAAVEAPVGTGVKVTVLAPCLPDGGGTAAGGRPAVGCSRPGGLPERGCTTTHSLAVSASSGKASR